MQSYHVVLLLGVLCVAIRAGQGTLELWLETGEAGRSSFKEVIFWHGKQLVENSTIALPACQDTVLFHWQSHQQVFYEISEEPSEELDYVATSLPSTGLVPYLRSTFFLYIKCGAVKESDSGQAKVVLNLYATENKWLGGNVITVEVIFMKDCNSACWRQDDDSGHERQGQQGGVSLCHLCLNGATCTGDNSTDVLCNCTSGFSGRFCETPVCQPSCQNGGLCVRPGRCLCNGSFIGPLCQTEGTLELTEEPNNTKLYCHRTASFRCSAKGTPTPHIFWFRNGDSVNATADPRFKIVQHEGDITSSTLFLYGVQSRDFGYYTCVAANEIARITRHAYLVVLGGCQADPEDHHNGQGSGWGSGGFGVIGDGEERSRRMTVPEDKGLHRSVAEESNLPPG